MPDPRKSNLIRKEPMNVISPKDVRMDRPKEQRMERPQQSRNISDFTKDKIVDMFIESNLSLQHKIADLLVETRELNKNVSGMVLLFTEAGENIKKGKYEDPLMVKLDDLLEQNKNIAKGLLLLEKFVREKQATQSAFAPRPFQKQEGL